MTHIRRTHKISPEEAELLGNQTFKKDCYSWLKPINNSGCMNIFSNNFLEDLWTILSYFVLRWEAVHMPELWERSQMERWDEKVWKHSCWDIQVSMSSSEVFEEVSNKVRYKYLTINFIFMFRFRLDLHLRTHDGRRPFQCPGCEYACARKDNLATHVKKQHKMSL